jgi:hypothetical protein
MHCAIGLDLQWLGTTRTERPDPSQPFGSRVKKGIPPPTVCGGSPADGDEEKRGGVGELTHEEEVLIWGMGRREAHRRWWATVAFLEWRWTPVRGWRKGRSQSWRGRWAARWWGKALWRFSSAGEPSEEAGTREVLTTDEELGVG